VTARSLNGGGPPWSVVVPTRRVSDRQHEMLKRLAEAFPQPTEIVVVADNVPARGESSPEGRVRCSEHRGTRGFGPTCNAGARAARGANLLFLNDDIRVGPGLLNALGEALGSHSIGAVGPDVWSLALGRSESGTRLFWHHGVLETRQDALSGEGAVEVPYLCGAVLAVRRIDFFAVGGFDERLAPYYWEDVDLSLRIQRSVGTTRVLSDVQVEHDHGATISTEPAHLRRRIYERNRLLVTWKTLSGSRWLAHLVWCPFRLLAATVRDPLTAVAWPLALARLRGRRGRAQS